MRTAATQGRDVLKSTQDTRHFFAAFSVRIGTHRVNYELAPAEEHGGPEGWVRVRKERRWVNTPEGAPRFFDRAALGDFIAAALDALPECPPCPDMPAKCRVSVDVDGGGIVGGWTVTPPVRGHAGEWISAVLLADGTTRFFPCDTITVNRRPRGAVNKEAADEELL